MFTNPWIGDLKYEYLQGVVLSMYVTVGEMVVWSVWILIHFLIFGE